MDYPPEVETRFLRGVLDAIPDSGAILNSAGEIIQVNRTWVDFAVTGSLDDPDYYIGKNYLRVCETTTGEERATAIIVAHAIRSMIDNEQSSFYVDYPCHSPTEQRWFMLRLGRFEFEDQCYIVVMHINITDRVMAEQQTLEYRTALETSRQFSEFIRQTAHEFRTPLSLITACLDLFRIQPDLGKRDQYLMQIDEQTHYLTQLTEQLNMLASMNSDESSEIGWVDCNQIARTAQRTLNRQAKDKQIALSLELQPELAPIYGDDYKLLFAVCELIENALRYTRPAASVIVRTRQNTTYVILEVADTGIGIRAADLDRIFDPYFKADPSRGLNTSGMGLGLTFVKKIVEMHQGRIEVESGIDHGTTFRIYLPIDRAPSTGSQE